MTRRVAGVSRLAAAVLGVALVAGCSQADDRVSRSTSDDASELDGEDGPDVGSGSSTTASVGSPTTTVAIEPIATMPPPTLPVPSTPPTTPAPPTTEAAARPTLPTTSVPAPTVPATTVAITLAPATTLPPPTIPPLTIPPPTVATRPPTLDQAARLFTDYLALTAAREYDAAWAMLTGRYQVKYLGYDNFVRFWETVEGAGVRSTSSNGTVTNGQSLDCYVWFGRRADGTVSNEHVHVDVIVDVVTGRFLIDDYRYLGVG